MLELCADELELGAEELYACVLWSGGVQGSWRMWRSTSRASSVRGRAHTTVGVFLGDESRRWLEGGTTPIDE